MSNISREQLETVGARFISGDELKKRGVDTGMLDLDLFFGYESDAKKRLRDAGFEIADDEHVIHRRSGDPVEAEEIAIYRGEIEEASEST